MTTTIIYNKYFLFYLETLIINVVFSIWEQKEPLFISQTVGDCFFPLICPRTVKTNFCLGNNIEWPTLTIKYLFILIFVRLFFFLHITHMNVKLISRNFQRFWSLTSNPKSPKGCPKLETPKFQQWQFFTSHLNVNFRPPKTSSLNSSTISPSRIFQSPKFYMISMHVCEGRSIIF
jgi:hypothetical protein